MKVIHHQNTKEKKKKMKKMKIQNLEKEKIHLYLLQLIEKIQIIQKYHHQREKILIIIKVRANLASIKNSFREIKNELESKLEHLENTQKLNYESIRNVIEQGGTDKLRASIKKNIDGKDINLDQFEEEMPGYMNDLPEMIDKRINIIQN